MKAFSFPLSVFVPIFMAVFLPSLSTRDLPFVQSRRLLLAVRVRIFTTPNQNTFLSELLNLRQRNVHGTAAQGITFIQPKSYFPGRLP